MFGGIPTIGTNKSGEKICPEFGIVVLPGPMEGQMIGKPTMCIKDGCAKWRGCVANPKYILAAPEDEKKGDVDGAHN